jgi:RNA polymerase sigma-32 factor
MQTAFSARSRPLAPAEQERLAALYSRTHDPRIEHRLIEANLRLVIKVARELDRTRGHQLDDLVQEGTLGLIKAIRRFDPAKGARLTTYAAVWIKAYVLKHIMDNARLVRVGTTRDQRKDFFRGTLGTTEVSFEARGGPSSSPVRDQLADPSPGAEEMLVQAELVRRAREETARLTSELVPREVAILHARLLADEPTTLRQLGRKLALSSERVRQIELALWTALLARLAARIAPLAQESN